MKRAKTSLPTPDSPVSITETSDSATRRASAAIRLLASSSATSEEKISGSCIPRSNHIRSDRFQQFSCQNYFLNGISLLQEYYGARTRGASNFRRLLAAADLELAHLLDERRAPEPQPLRRLRDDAFAAAERLTDQPHLDVLEQVLQRHARAPGRERRHADLAHQRVDDVSVGRRLVRR